jgi:hypothetical protein
VGAAQPCEQIVLQTRLVKQEEVVELDGPTTPPVTAPTACAPVDVKSGDMMTLWTDCSHGQFVQDFLANCDEAGASDGLPRPVQLLIKASNDSCGHDKLVVMYATLMAGLASQQPASEFYENLPGELCARHATSGRSSPWGELIALFTWCAMMMRQWPGRYPKIAAMCEHYLRLVEPELVQEGGWDSFERFIAL